MWTDPRLAGPSMSRLTGQITDRSTNGLSRRSQRSRACDNRAVHLLAKVGARYDGDLMVVGRVCPRGRAIVPQAVLLGPQCRLELDLDDSLSRRVR